MAFKFKFTESNFQEFKRNPEKFFQESGFQFSPEQKEFFKNQDFSNFSFDEFKNRVQKSKMFGGFFDFS